MAKYLDLEGLNYNNQKIRDYADAVINSPDNLLDNSRNYSIISHCVIGPSANGSSEASIGAFEETFNGYPARYMTRSTFDYIDTYDTIKVKFDTTKLKAGKTYSYKVRGCYLVNGEKVYTDFSNEVSYTVQ